jgi:ATP-binding cassette subfamily C (CFTR/MRP) protein 1/ATP-binding cassette subfamily C (CFTR/MRP) protein 3
MSKSSSQGLKTASGTIDYSELSPSGLPKRRTPSYLSHLFFFWAGDYVKLAKNVGKVTGDDLPYVRVESETAKLNKRFLEQLFYFDKGGEKVQRSLRDALGRTFYAPLLLTGFLSCIEIGSKLCTPLLISKLLGWFEQEDAATSTGVWYAVGLVLATFLGQGLVWAHSAMISFAMGMDVRTVCNSQVYRKAMVLSPSARNQTSTGELVTFMSTDCERLPQTFVTIHNFWSAPIIIILGIIYLYSFIGPASLVGVSVLLVSVPIQGLIAFSTFKAQKGMSKHTDGRNNLINEALQGIKILKLYGWEDSYMKRIEKLRKDEMEYCATYTYRSALMIFMFIGIPLLLNLSVFSVHYALGGDMTPKTIFTAMSLIGIIRFPLVMLPMTIQSAVSASLALGRMDRFFRLEEMVETREECKEEGNVVELEGVFSWGEKKRDEGGGGADKKGADKKGADKKDADKEKDTKPSAVIDASVDAPVDIELTEVPASTTAPPSLFEINIPSATPLHIKKGELIAVVGTVGSGKSSLIGACLGELEVSPNNPTKPHVGLSGTIGLAAQTPWIVNNTLRGNVIMGRDYDRARFDHAVATCALDSDITMLPAGIDTEIGEKGINLSGGQKARVALARAVYADPDIYMLDDPLSAVDAHVGKHLFEKAIKKEMNGKGKTVLFATNQLFVLDKVDRIIMMQDGKIGEVGTYTELMNGTGPFQQLIEEFNANTQKEAPDAVQRARSLSGDGRTSLSEVDDVLLEKEVDMVEEGKLIEKEGLDSGKVDPKVFLLYFVKAVGDTYFVISCLLLLSMTTQAVQNVHELMVGIWTTNAEDDDKFRFYFILWACLGFTSLTLALLRAWSWAWQAISASTRLHDKLLQNVLRCKMSFFDTTPIGRILNRFTKDFYMVDIELPRNVSNFIVCLMSVLGSFTMIGVVLPWFFIVMFPILAYYYYVQDSYRPLSRDLQRIESASRSPIFATFSEAVSGVTSVRAYGIGNQLCDKCDRLIDEGNNAFYLMHISNRWLQVRLDALAGFTMSFVCFFIILGRTSAIITVDSGMAGLLITYVQMVTGLMNWTVRMGCETEARITSVERIVEYSELNEVEAASIVEDYRPAASWPEKGEIKLENLCMRYREGLPLVLDGVNLLIPGGSRVGVAGRTGSGKSSLLVSLFRLAEPTSDSKIIIDGYDCCKGGLGDVRKAISIIPQDPVMFQGTVKTNVDPTDSYSDEEIMKAVRESQLGEDAVAKLDDVVEDGGSNFSVGQRQLFCLARALLRKSKILVLDEATANVDVQTDEKLQKTLREKFADCTVVTIAHRLNTIADSDYILVMDSGKVGEFDTPAKLQADKESMWSKLLKSERGNMTK